MRLGIVGAEAAKFDAQSESAARHVIRALIAEYRAAVVISGACHLGGVDTYAAEEARALSVPVIEHRPASLDWTSGYKPRNIQIAEDSDVVFSLVVRTLPPTYRGMRFERDGQPYCYHCDQLGHHVKSGGCWTVKYARTLGKDGHVVVVLDWQGL